MGDYLEYEELMPGRKFRSPGRTLSEADVVTFAGLSGDYAELHTNEVYMRTQEFGQRICHGLLGLAVESGLGTRAMPPYGAVAFLGIQEWVFRKPIFIGTTVYSEIEVLKKRQSASRPGCGVMTMARRLVNEGGETLQEGRTVSLVRLRES